MIRARYGPHDFPHRRIYWRVRPSRKLYPCETLLEPRPPDHRAHIEPGAHYAKVSIRPDPADEARGRSKWTNLRLCAGCAVAYGLAERLDSGPDPSVWGAGA